MPRLLFRSWTVLILLSVPAAAAEPWLTPAEKAFFEAMGADAIVDGKKYSRPFNPRAMQQLARTAESPLRGRVQAFLQALEETKATPQELQRLGQAQERAIFDMQAGMVLGIFDILIFGDDPWEVGLDLAGNLLNSDKGISAVWKVQADIMARAQKARARSVEAVERVTQGLGERLGEPAPMPDRAISVKLDKKNLLVIEGLAIDAPMTQPVVRIGLHRIDDRANWLGINALSLGLLGLLGVPMNPAAISRGLTLTEAQGEAMNAPVYSTCLLPDVPTGKKFTLNLRLPAIAVSSLERVELQVWHGGGWSDLTAVPGLEETRAKAQKLTVEMRKTMIRRYSNNLAEAEFNRQMSAAMNEAQRRQLLENLRQRHLFQNGSAPQRR